MDSIIEAASLKYEEATDFSMKQYEKYVMGEGSKEAIAAARPAKEQAEAELNRAIADKEAYEKQASFLIAQSRAMGTLMSLIKQYEEMCNSELATEEQKLRIEKLKTEITKATDEEPVKVEIIDNISNVEVNTNANKFE